MPGSWTKEMRFERNYLSELVDVAVRSMILVFCVQIDLCIQDFMEICVRDLVTYARKLLQPNE